MYYITEMGRAAKSAENPVMERNPCHGCVKKISFGIFSFWHGYVSQGFPHLSQRRGDNDIERYCGGRAWIKSPPTACDSIAAAVGSKRKGERRDGSAIAFLQFEAGSLLG